MATVNLGDKVKDTISGLVGIAISRCEFLHGCVRVCVQPQETKDGKPVDTTYIDEPQLVVVKSAVAKSSVGSGKHGTRPDATRAADPRR